MWMPFSTTDNNFGFYFSATYQLLSSFHSCFAVVTLDALPIFFMSYVIAFVKVINVEIKALTDKNEGRRNVEIAGTSNRSLYITNQTKEDEEIMQKLTKLIKIQIKVKEIVMKIENLFTGVFLVQGSMSVFILCMIPFLMIFVSEKLFKSIKNFNKNLFHTGSRNFSARSLLIVLNSDDDRSFSAMLLWK